MLTVFPVPDVNIKGEDIAGGVKFFPLVGMVLGMLLFAVAMGLEEVFPPLPAAAILTILPEFFTRGFHLDGLADSADGLLSSRSRERMLEIMKDSHTGSMGVLAIVSVMLLKFAALSEIAAGTANLLPVSAALASLGGRCAIVMYIAFSRYARKEGTGKALFERSQKTVAVGAAICFGVISLLFSSPLTAAVLTAALLCLTAGWKVFCTRAIGGATGDTVGACEEMGETLILMLLAVLP